MCFPPFSHGWWTLEVDAGPCPPLPSHPTPTVSVEIPPGQGFSGFDVRGLVKIKTQWFPAGPKVLRF